MYVSVQNIHSEAEATFSGTPEEVYAQLLERFPWLQRSAKDVHSAIERLSQQQAFVVKADDDDQLGKHLKKAPEAWDSADWGNEPSIVPEELAHQHSVTNVGNDLWVHHYTFEPTYPDAEAEHAYHLSGSQKPNRKILAEVTGHTWDPEGLNQPYFQVDTSVTNSPGHGHGRNLYRHILHSHGKLVSDARVSHDAQRLYEALGKEPGVVFIPGDHTKKTNHLLVWNGPKMSEGGNWKKSEEELDKMAIAGNRPAAKQHPELGFSYTHLLPEEARANGVKMFVQPMKGIAAASAFRSYLQHPEFGRLGFVEGYVPDNSTRLKIGHSRVDDQFRGMGLGKAIYEALMTHVYHHHGVREVTGAEHSTLAMHTHKALANKHKFNYHPEPNIGENGYRSEDSWQGASGAYDEKYAPYNYMLKDEMDMATTAQKLEALSLKKDEPILDDHLKIANRMLKRPVSELFEAARFLAGGKALSQDEIRSAYLIEDGDLEEAALTAYGLPCNAEMRATLHALLDAAELSKGEESAVEPQIVLPLTDDAVGTASALERAYSEGAARKVNLGGKHSHHSEVLKDPKTGKTYLIKYEEGGQSPAAGINEERANQPRREAAFWHVANLVGEGSSFPRADLVSVGGQEAVAMALLATSYQNLEDVREKGGLNHIMMVLDKYVRNGQVYKWATLDMVLANVDRHAGNLMIEGDDLMLIDQGSSFAGPSFAPAKDKNSFIPFYLRAWFRKGFSRATPKEKYDRMPKLDEGPEKVLSSWVHSIEPFQVERILKNYGINPAPTLERLIELKHASNKSEFLARFWSGYY